MKLVWFLQLFATLVQTAFGFWIARAIALRRMSETRPSKSRTIIAATCLSWCLFLDLGYGGFGVAILPLPSILAVIYLAFSNPNEFSFLAITLLLLQIFVIGDAFSPPNERA